MTEAAVIAELKARLESLEAQAEIRALMARYMEICDHLDADTPMEELASLFTEDAVWGGKGDRYSMAFGAHRGRSAIVAFLDEYRKPPHFAMNAHFLTSETIVVEGASAEGTWMMLQTPTFSSGGSYLMSARLDIGFRKDGGHWRIERFQTENLFGRKMNNNWNDGEPVPKPGSAT